MGDPTLVTEAVPELGTDVTVPTAIVPVLPCGPVGPVGPSRRTKLKVPALDEPTFVTDAVPLLATEEVDPTAMVAADPAAPCGPVGIPRLSVWFGARPVMVAVAADPVARVVTVPMLNDEASE